jgi:deoxycytidylate deaminase
VSQWISPAAYSLARSIEYNRPEMNDRSLQKLSAFWRFANELAPLSCCKRAQVGCIVVPLDLTEVLSIGYNGPAAGLPNDGCREVEGGCGCVHAESNAVAKLHAGGRHLMLTTTLQCEHCAGMVVNSRRIGWIVYGNEYRDPRGAELLRAAGVWVASAQSLGL